MAVEGDAAPGTGMAILASFLNAISKYTTFSKF